MKAPLRTFLGDTYKFRWADEQVDLLMERLHESKSGDLTAEIEVRCSRDVPNALMHHARLNLISTRSRADVIKALANRVPEHEIDWSAAIEYVCHLAIKQWREGDPIIDLRLVQPREGTRFLLDPYVEHAGATVLFADGGVGKSMFGLSIGAAIASGRQIVGAAPEQPCPVLYLDWESDPETHADRLRAICDGAGIDVSDTPIFYRRQSASLAEAAPHIRRVVAEQLIGFVIVDSLGAARGGEPESADSTIRLFNAARTLGVPWLGIDHVTKNGGDGQPKPFGSVYTHNLARLTWGMEKVEDFGNGHVIVALTNHKTNNGRPLGRRGYDIEFREDANGRPQMVRYQSKDTREIPQLFGRMKQPQQIAEVLRANRKAMFVDDIQRALEADGVVIKAEQIRVLLNQNKGMFVGMAENGKTKWGLLARAVG